MIGVLAGANFSARSQDADKGQTEFWENCAECHGADAKGSGPHSIDLKVKPADLTTLAKRNGGVFDPGAVYQMIDGRQARLNHRNAEMPIWGCRHKDAPSPPAAITEPNRKYGNRLAARKKQHEPALESLLDLPCDSEATIRSRILSIVGYLSLIQQR
jgi:hypothetical protein